MQEEQWKRKPHDVTESMAQSLSARAFLCELPAKGEAATARHVKVKSLHKQQTTYYGKPIEGALEASDIWAQLQLEAWSCSSPSTITLHA